MPTAAHSALYRGRVMHERLHPFRHRFAYRVFSLLLDLDELERLDAELRLFAYNRRGLLSFHDRDHGPRDGSPLRPWVEAQLAAAGLHAAAHRIELLSFPRLLGYVFNPLSVYYCSDASGTLRAILYEVKNTFGGQHGYVLPVEPAAEYAGHDRRAVKHRCAKRFYVSPFLPMECDYGFRLTRPGRRLSIAIRQSSADGPVLLATHTARRRPLTDGEILRAVLRHPLMTRKVIAAIHWEALWLWIKGARLIHRPKPHENGVSLPGGNHVQDLARPLRP